MSVAETLTHKPRGIRNNNPGNIRWCRHNVWMGQSGKDDHGFCIFTDAHFGIRAMMVLIVHYARQNPSLDIYDLVTRYAPPMENDCQAYRLDLVRITGLRMSEVITIPEDIPSLIEAIITHENGQCPYREEELQEVLKYYPLHT